MAILKIARAGHPVLRKVALPILPADIQSPDVQGLIDDMLATVEDIDGAGLAAPQVHVPLRMVVLQVRRSEGMLVWINPVVEALTDQHIVTWEGCLSAPGLRGAVARPARVRVRGLNHAGEPFERELEGYPAVVAQHECDHLDGVLYIDKVLPQTLSFLEEYRRYGDEALAALGLGGEE